MSHAELLAALGDETRLSLVTRLSQGRSRSIAELAQGLPISRQAVTKHLRIMERVGLVRAARSGRTQLYRLDPQPLRELQEYLGRVSAQWDDALDRLKAFVEDDGKG